jgi:hypothetical protein
MRRQWPCIYHHGAQKVPVAGVSKRTVNPPHLLASNFPQFDAAAGPWGNAPRALSARFLPMLLPLAGGRGTVVKFWEFIMILELHRWGMTIAAIARQLGIDRKSAKEEVLANVAERKFDLSLCDDMAGKHAAGNRNAAQCREGRGCR